MGAIRKSEFTQPTPIQAQVKAQWALIGATAALRHLCKLMGYCTAVVVDMRCWYVGK